MVEKLKQQQEQMEKQMKELQAKNEEHLKEVKELLVEARQHKQYEAVANLYNIKLNLEALNLRQMEINLKTNWENAIKDVTTLQHENARLAQELEDLKNANEQSN